uniref:Reverse transcriptase domain-containing protein n=1 Tax=Haemonchus contortus TaxID=6289 RepID=A0A7I5EE48_HAECO
MSHLITCTYNCRSVSTAIQLSNLIEESQRISYHVIGLSETKRKETLTCTWSDGTAVFLGARETGSTSGGVGFIVAPEFAKKVTSVTFYSHRFGILTATLTKDISVSIIQVYAPTSDCSDDQHEDFYDYLGELVRSQKSSYVVVSGDFNARVGGRGSGERFIGPNCAEQRNAAGERLANFCEIHHMFHGNSQFVKAPTKRWTYVSPNGQYYHELDHILCSRRAITDVGVVPSFNTGSDHRLLRARLHFERSHVRLSRIQARQPRATVLDTNALKTLIENVPLDMKEDINEDYDYLLNTLSTLASQSRTMAPNHNSRRMSDATRNLLAKRRQMDRKNNHVEYTLLNRLCRQRLDEDLKNFYRYRLLDAASNRRSVKKTKRELAQYRLTISCLKGPDGSRTTSRPEMESILTNFYSNLFKSDHGGSTEQIPIGEMMPSFLPSEVRHAIETMPKGKAPGADGLSLEALQACGHKIHCALAQRFTRYVNDCKAPDAWRKSKTILLFKKGDKEDSDNYRPITLLPVLYKVFTRCLLARIRRQLDEAQPVEQAAFRRKFSTLDYIITCCRIIEAVREYHEPLILTFIDYRKAFDSIERGKIWSALNEQGIDPRYTEILKECYSGCVTVFRPFFRDLEVTVEKGVRQGDPISPNLFAACLEYTIRHCAWDSKGIKIDGRYLSHLRFADDLVLIS